MIRQKRLEAGRDYLAYQRSLQQEQPVLFRAVQRCFPALARKQ